MKADDILAQMREIERRLGPIPREPSLFDSIYKPQTFAGMKVYERPPPGPKLQLRDITLSDGTKLFTSEFRAEMNAWLLERFGHAPDPFGDRIFMLSGFGLSVSPKHAAMLVNIA